MADWPMIAARLALYGDLGLLFGIPLFALHSRPNLSRRAIAGLWAGLAGCGVLLVLIAFGLQIAAMGGTGLGDIDPTVARMLVAQTAVGWAFIARLAALVLGLAVALLLPERPFLPALLTLCGGTALATLAWSGHGAAGEGAQGLIRLGADILHLLAAAAWIGALAMLILLVAPRGPATHKRLDAAHDALRRFGMIGTIIVALIAVTGLANTAFIVGAGGLRHVAGSPYGRLLILKLVLFAGMLGCAAINRFRLTPRLAAAPNAEAAAQTLSGLRRSIALESLFALLVIALVAWLGTLEPPA